MGLEGGLATAPQPPSTSPIGSIGLPKKRDNLNENGATKNPNWTASGGEQPSRRQPGFHLGPDTPHRTAPRRESTPPRLGRVPGRPPLARSPPCPRLAQRRHAVAGLGQCFNPSPIAPSPYGLRLSIGRHRLAGQRQQRAPRYEGVRPGRALSDWAQQVGYLAVLPLPR